MKNIYLQGLALGAAILLVGCGSSSGGGSDAGEAKAIVIFQNTDVATCNQLEEVYDGYEEDGVDIDVTYFDSNKECSDFGMTEADYYDDDEYYDGGDYCSVTSYGGGSCVVEASGDAYMYYGPSRMKSSIERMK